MASPSPVRNLDPADYQWKKVREVPTTVWRRSPLANEAMVKKLPLNPQVLVSDAYWQQAYFMPFPLTLLFHQLRHILLIHSSG